VTLDSISLQFRAFYIFLLIALWVTATLANVISITGLAIHMVGLVGISVFLAGLMYRTVRNMVLEA